MNSETKKLCGEILQKLLEKYDQRSAKQVDTKRRITLRPSEIYKAYAANNADIRQRNDQRSRSPIGIQAACDR